MSQNKFIIRDQLIPGDFQSIKEILESTGFFYDYEIEVALELVNDNLAKGLKSEYYFLLAELEGKAKGYCCYGPIACTEGSYDLYWIVVHKDFQGQGVGRELLKEAEQKIEALGGRGIYVETASRPQYTQTRAFYAKTGYIVEAMLKDFYSPGDDKVIFVKKAPFFK
jgi:ribosomal protein S18 acetylase RimI-like enzyme